MNLELETITHKDLALLPNVHDLKWLSYRGIPQFLRFCFPSLGNVSTILDCQNSNLKSLTFVTNHTKSTSIGSSLLEAYWEKY